MKERKEGTEEMREGKKDSGKRGNKVEELKIRKKGRKIMQCRKSGGWIYLYSR